MEVLFIILNDLSYLDEILAKFIELEVRGATLLDSEGMASAIMKAEGMGMLMSGPFQHSFEHIPSESKTIFTVIRTPEKSEAIVEAVREILGSSKQKVVGFMFSIPVSGIFPIKSNQ